MKSLQSFVNVFDSGDKLPRSDIITGIKSLIDNYYSMRPLPYHVVHVDYPFFQENPDKEATPSPVYDSDSSISTQSDTTHPLCGLSSRSIDEFSDENHERGSSTMPPASQK